MDESTDGGALSPDEQRRLDELARRLRLEDPALAELLGGGRARSARLAVARPIAAMIAAFAVAVIVGVVSAPSTPGPVTTSDASRSAQSGSAQSPSAPKVGDSMVMIWGQMGGRAGVQQDP